MKPRFTLDDQLPIAACEAELADLITNHQVVVVAGETGSGKTTQLPKIALSLGRSRIAHTQPRRIAARTVATRIAEEIGVPLGDLVGYQVRFTRQASATTQLKVMTDGILLAEIAHDPQLQRYDTIIIDEAHERSLNIDFLLGYLKQLLPKRADLKVIITSATIDTTRFSKHFFDAPIVEVSGRTYPVEIRYKEPSENAITDAIKEIFAQPGGGDILVFLPGEREINEAAEQIAALNLDLDVKPLFARASASAQLSVFEQHRVRRVVLATNIAETSVTVPGIRYVIDTGTARISRYSTKSKVQRLPIEPISQASANQRAGRCGRLGPGVAIRLYTEEDFLSRPAFTQPEILRTNLATVILQMAGAGLGHIESFPFVEAPVASQIGDGLRVLQELGAIEQRKRGADVRLTALGRKLAVLPLDPRLSRMLVDASDRRALSEMLIVVAALAIQDVRERPAEHKEAADAKHRRFMCEAEPPKSDATSSEPARHSPHTGTRKEAPKADAGGDIAAILRLWNYLQTERKERSNNGFKKMCKEEFLHYLRVREWEDLHSQLKGMCQDVSLRFNDRPASMKTIVTCVLSGLASHVGLLEAPQESSKRRKPLRTYLGARGTHFAIAPGSAVAKTLPQLVVAVELVETNRLWARTIASIDAGQIEAVCSHVLTKRLSDPYFSRRNGRAEALEKVSLFGVPIVAGRRVDYARQDASAARELFITAGLVEGQWVTRHRFLAHNLALRSELEELEGRARRRDLVVSDDVLAQFYESRLPPEVVSGRTLDAWLKDPANSRALHMTKGDLLARSVEARGFPDVWTVGKHELATSYVFSPGAQHDGVHVNIALSVMPQLDAAPFSWQVPGLRLELATQLIRSLPKRVRTSFIPAPDFAAAALEWLDNHRHSAQEPFELALSRALMALTGERVAPKDWDAASLPDHLRVWFVITDDGATIAQGRDLEALRETLKGRLTKKLTDRSQVQSSGQSSWTFGTIKPSISVGDAVGFPGLVDEGRLVGARVFESEATRDAAHKGAMVRLVSLTTPDPTRWVVAHMTNRDKLALAHSSYASVPELLADARLKAIGRLMGDRWRVFNEASFLALANDIRPDLADTMRDVSVCVGAVLREQLKVNQLLSQFDANDPAALDVQEQLANLTFDRFISQTPDPWFQRLPKYVAGAGLRLEAALVDRDRDDARRSVVDDVEDAFAIATRDIDGPLPPKLEEIVFLIEELRIQTFAQTLKTSVPVSRKRILQALAQAMRSVS